jgi:DNA polymerase-1
VSTLLAVDGDSFAHRAYHALPKSIRLNAVVGFTNMLIRLWQAERPDGVLVAWDTLSVPTYRHEAFEPYQSGRVFEDSIVEQLEILPEVVSAFGFLVAKAPGYEADDFLAAVAREWAGDVLVATSDRDAFQLASDRVTILQPQAARAAGKAGDAQRKTPGRQRRPGGRGVSELARIGPAEVRERYGVEPEQVTDLIALRGDPSDKLPGARGIGPKKAAELLGQYGSLEAALADGRFAAEAEDLRLFRRIATMDASAPLPPLAETPPAWAEASSFLTGLGLDGVAARVGELSKS